MTNPLGNKIYLIVGLIVIVGIAIAAFFLFPDLTKETTNTPSDSAEKTTIVVRVEEVNTEDGILTVLQLGNGAIYKVRVSEDLKITDSKTGESLGLENIKVGQTIKLILNSPPTSGSSGGSQGSSGGGSGGSSGSGESNGDDGIIVIDDPDGIDVLPPDPEPNTIPKVK